jgi:periplasmic divalent cation tolerance protein
MTDQIVVLVTCSSTGQALKIARALVTARLAACGNVIQAPVRSIYRWKGRVESAKEFLLILKTTRWHFAAIGQAVRSLHTYELPEIIAVPIATGARDYLAWIAESVAPGKG